MAPTVRIPVPVGSLPDDTDIARLNAHIKGFEKQLETEKQVWITVQRLLEGTVGDIKQETYQQASIQYLETQIDFLTHYRYKSLSADSLNILHKHMSEFITAYNEWESDDGIPNPTTKGNQNMKNQFEQYNNMWLEQYNNMWLDQWIV
jgi:hypothetical protein